MYDVSGQLGLDETETRFSCFPKSGPDSLGISEQVTVRFKN